MTVNNIYRGIPGDSSAQFNIGDAFTTAQNNDDSLNASKAENVNSVAALRLLDKTKISSAETKGYYTAGDGGHGKYWYDASDTTSADNGFTVIVGADGGRWKLQPTNSKYLITQAGAVGDTGTDNKSAFSAINLSGASVVIPEGIFTTTETFVFSGVGRSIEGVGQGKSVLNADFVSGAALRLLSQYQSASNFSITGSATRYAAAYTSNGFGIHAETADVPDDPTVTRMRGLNLSNIDISGQTGAAVYLVGPVTDGGKLQSLRCFNNKGHGLAVDRGFLGGRVNKSTLPTGVINVTNMLSFGNTGHAIALGHKDDTTTTQTVRAVIDNLDANVSSMDLSQLYNATNLHGVWMAGSNNELINSVVSGSGSQMGAYVKGTNNSIRNFRQVNTSATLEVGDNVAGLPTRDITLDGVNVVNAVAQTNAVILSNATDIRDVSIRISNTAGISNIVDTTLIRGLKLNNPTALRRSTSDTVYNNTTTPTAINGLSYRAAANEAFRFRAGIFYSGDTAADVRLTVGSTASVSLIEFGSPSGTKIGASLAVDVIAAVTALNSPISLGADASKRYFEMSGYIVNGATAATITINAAQLSAVSADTTIHAGSNLTIESF